MLNAQFSNFGGEGPEEFNSAWNGSDAIHNAGPPHAMGSRGKLGWIIRSWAMPFFAILPAVVTSTYLPRRNDRKYSFNTIHFFGMNQMGVCVCVCVSAC